MKIEIVSRGKRNLERYLFIYLFNRTNIEVKLNSRCRWEWYLPLMKVFNLDKNFVYLEQICIWKILLGYSKK